MNGILEIKVYENKACVNPSILINLIFFIFKALQCTGAIKLLKKQSVS